MARILRYLILGGLGGFIGWMVVEPFDYLTPPGNPSMSYGQILLLGALIGLFIGLALGVAEMLSGVSPRDALKSVLIGAAVGIAGGALGLAFGSAFYGPLHWISETMKGGTITTNGNVIPGRPSMLGFLIELIGRSIGWALFGFFLGISQGLSVQSTKKMVNGAVGGFIGGGLGGFTFAVLNSMNGSGAIAIPTMFMRLVGFTITGAAIGLFIGLIEEMTKKAWLVHLKGRNEGRQFEVFKPETVVGRNELIDVPIFGDPDVEPRHFVIKANERRHTIQDLGTVAGTSVNGQKLQQPQPLRDGDIIQVGMTKLLFRDKATRTPNSHQPGSYTGGPQIPTSDRICPFCGSIKDASGNCSCSVGGTPVPQQPGPTLGQTQSATVMQPPQMPPQASPTQTIPMGTPISGAIGGAKLVGVSGPFAGQVFGLVPGGEMTIGRQSDRSISLSMDNTVSRQHARIADEGGRFVLYDLGSANGTYVNNSKVTSHVLTNGDLIQIGSTKFRYEG